jgi:2-polyprenyl-3-methyl-5-hydroxy-6-metoxy-1,4-benzoquinol methylase
VDPQYGERYRELFEKHWWWRARTELIVRTIRRLALTERQTILDIGCGDGLFFEHLAQFGSVEGLEFSADLVRPDNPFRDRIHIGGFDESFRPGKQYSLVLMLDVLEHLADPIAALRHALNLLLPDGRFLATVPAFNVLWTNHDVINHHQIRYTKASFRDLADKSGLEIMEMRYLYHWTFPVKLAVRMAERIVGSKPAPPKIPSKLVNETLLQATRLEQRTISRLPMPFGTSLMVVGKKTKLAS